MRWALNCGGVRSPPSAPEGGGAASAALSDQATQRGSTTFVVASLHRALTLGASSREGSGRDKNTPLPPPPPRRRRPPRVAATHSGRLRSGLGLTTPGLGPRALCSLQGRPAGRGKTGATGLRLSLGAANMRGWAESCFRGDGGGGVSESIALGMGPDFLLPSPKKPRWRRCPFPPRPRPSTRRLLVCATSPCSPLPFPLRSSSRGGRATRLASWALTSTTPPSRLTSRPFPSVQTQGQERARTSRSKKAEGEWCQGPRRREQSYRAPPCSLPSATGVWTGTGVK